MVGEMHCNELGSLSIGSSPVRRPHHYGDGMPADVTVADVESALRGVVDPELGADVVDLGMVSNISISDGVATVGIALTIAACPMRDQIEGDVIRKVTAIPRIERTEVTVTAMTERQRSELMSVARRMARQAVHRQ